ncbi:MAG: RluA family pseudouridine synthase, partial [Planctomycetes bacterium]|nr:RluA family pseudouridine synthase [Planctomycetota bacterium]
MRDLSEPIETIAIRVRSMEKDRLDVYLRRKLRWKSRTHLQEVISEGRVRVNGTVRKASYAVKAGDLIEVAVSHGTGVPGDYRDLAPEILYEDEWIIAVNKPPGILVHPAGRHVYDTVLNYLHFRYRGAERGRAPRLAHRLDRDTTGVLLAVRDEETGRDLQHQFEGRRVTKVYRAVVAGSPPWDRVRIERPIGERPARTDVEVLARLGPWAEVECRPLTGRQNQIRIHLAGEGFPIAGDAEIAGDAARSAPPLPPRYLLH